MNYLIILILGIVIILIGIFVYFFVIKKKEFSLFKEGISGAFVKKEKGGFGFSSKNEKEGPARELPEKDKEPEGERKTEEKRPKKIKSEEELREDKSEIDRLEEKERVLKEEVNIRGVNFEEILKNIPDENLKETVETLELKKMIKFGGKNVLLKTKGEVLNFVKQEIEDFLKNKLDNLKDELSELRKIGKDTKIMDFKIISVPLKIKMFFATFKKKDLEKVLLMIEEIEKEIRNLQPKEKVEIEDKSGEDPQEKIR